MARAKKDPVPLPGRDDILDYIKNAKGKITKRDIARAFHVRGPDKVHLKKILRDLTHDGLIAHEDSRSSIRPADRLPGVMVITVTGLDADGHPLIKPLDWKDTAGNPPLIQFEKSGRGRTPAPGVGERFLARLEQVNNTPPKYKAHIMKRLKAEADTMLGVFKGGENGGRLNPVDKRNRDEYLIPPEDTGGATDGELVLASLTGKGGSQRSRNTPRMARVLERLGDLTEPKSISLIAIHTHEIPHIFPEKALQEAAKAKPVQLGNREDLRDIPLITIDPSDARDHDDAIFAEPDTDPVNDGGWHLIVAIADVAHYVPSGGAIDKEALKRGNSCYFPDRVVPMLPEALSTDLCSLKPGVERACLAAHMWLNARGELIRHHFTRGLMKSRANVSYEAVQKALDGFPDDQTEPLLEGVLVPLYDAYKCLAQARDKRGPLDLDLPERKITLSDAGVITNIQLRERLNAHRIVEDFMITANVAAAEALEAKRLPPVYRVHEEPPMEKLETLREFLDSLELTLTKGAVMRPALFNGILRQVNGKAEEKLVNEVVLRSQTQAYYSPENQGHFGLALPRYAHFTSPIRRYADLMVHRALVSAFHLGKDGLTPEDAANLSETAQHISQTERRAMVAERESTERYMAAYLKDRVGQDFEGRVSGVSRFGLFVTLEPSGGDGLIPISDLGDDYFELDETGHALLGARSRKTYQLGDLLDVRLMEANEYTGGLRLALLQDGQQISPRARRGARGNSRNGAKGPRDHKHSRARETTNTSPAGRNTQNKKSASQKGFKARNNTKNR